LLKILQEEGKGGHARFLIATHSPLILACPGARIYSFDHVPVKEITYEETDHYQLFKAFLENGDQLLRGA
jgi:predicted ATPase